MFYFFYILVLLVQLYSSYIGYAFLFLQMYIKYTGEYVNNAALNVFYT